MSFVSKAQVVSVSPPDGLYVLLPSGQIPSAPVKVLTHGPADAMRVKKSALPTPGTWGIVMFPADDMRNGVWAGSYYSQFVQGHDSTIDPHQEYESHYSGYYRSMDKSGNMNMRFPDGTSVVVGNSPALATTHRQTVNPSQIPEPTVFTPAQRVPNPPGAFNIVVNHPSGLSITITPAGGLIINVAAGQTVEFDAGGSPVTNSLALVSTLVAWLTSHTHQAQGATAVTSIPLQALTAATIASQVVKTSG